MEENRPQEEELEALTSYVPKKLAERVKTLASKGKRSISAEVWRLIEEALELEEQRRAS